MDQSELICNYERLTTLSPTASFKEKTPKKNHSKIQIIDNVKLKSPTLPTPLKHVTTPFKKALFWPESSNNDKVKRVVKKITPTLATSEEFIEYQRRIEAEKKKREEEKLERMKKRKKNQPTKKDKRPKPNSKGMVQDQLEETLENKSDNKDVNEAKLIDGEYVVVNYEGEFFPGLIIGSDENGTIVKTMTMSGPHWRWPEKDDILTYTLNDIVVNIKPPSPINKRGVYAVPDIEELRKL